MPKTTKELNDYEGSWYLIRNFPAGKLKIVSTMEQKQKAQQIFKQLNITGSRYGNAEVESIVKATVSVTAQKIFEEIEMKCGNIWVVDTLKKSAKYQDLKRKWKINL